MNYKDDKVFYLNKEIILKKLKLDQNLNVPILVFFVPKKV